MAPLGEGNAREKTARSINHLRERGAGAVSRFGVVTGGTGATGGMGLHCQQAIGLAISFSMRR